MAESIAASLAPPSLRESAAVIGAAVWHERRAFEVVGSLVATIPEPRVKAVFSTVSRHHAFRADLLASVLPRTHDLTPDDVIVAGAGSESLDELDSTGSTGSTRLTGELVDRLAEVLQSTVVRLGGHRARLVPVSDAPLHRVLGIVLADLEADRDAVLAATR